MKQLHHTAGYATFDLTECKINRLVDGDGNARFVLTYPSKWTEGERQRMDTPSGTVNHRPYYVTEWEEVEIDVKPDIVCKPFMGKTTTMLHDGPKRKQEG